MDGSPWWTVAVSIVPSAAVGIWTVMQWLSNRHDRREERALSYEEKRDAEIERERHAIAESHATLLKDLRSDIERYRKLIDEKNTDRYHAWDRARYWHQKAWDMRNEAAYARQMVESMHRIAGEPPHNWHTPLDLPPFDDDVRAPLSRSV